MAISDYNTFAIEFDITERVLQLEEAPEAAHALAAEVTAKLAPLAAYPFGDDEEQNQKGDEKMREIMADPEYHQLVHDEHEARTTREVVARACDGSFTSPTSDLSVDIYKNWAYLRSPSAWQEGWSFVEPTIAQLTHGEMKIGGLYIHALEAPQGGIGIVAYTDEYGDDDKGHYSRYRGMIGVGVHAHEETQEEYISDAPARFVGVTPETIAWLRSHIGNEFPEFLKSVDFGVGRHFNQGDAFFAGEFGIDTPTSEAGETSEPLINDALKGFEARLTEIGEDEQTGE